MIKETCSWAVRQWLVAAQILGVQEPDSSLPPRLLSGRWLGMEIPGLPGDAVVGERQQLRDGSDDRRRGRHSHNLDLQKRRAQLGMPHDCPPSPPRCDRGKPVIPRVRSTRGIRSWLRCPRTRSLAPLLPPRFLGAMARGKPVIPRVRSTRGIWSSGAAAGVIPTVPSTQGIRTRFREQGPDPRRRS